MAIAATLLTTLAAFQLNSIVGYTAISLVYLSVVLLLGLMIGRGPLIVAATISAVAWDFCFIPPRFTLQIGRLEDNLTLGIYFIVAMTMGNLMARLRLREQVLRSREERITAVYNFSRLLSRSTGLEETAHKTIAFIGEFFGARVSLNLRNYDGTLDSRPVAASTRRLTPGEVGAASWVFERRRPAGRNTEIFPLATGTYYPLISTDGIVGVLGLRMQKRVRLRPDQEEILSAFVNHAAIAIERDFLASEKRRARIAEESEKLHAAILNSLSHELRTPIAVIRGAVSAMQLKSTADNAPARAALLSEADIAVQRLNVLVSNLLDMSRIEAGKIRLNRELHDMREILRNTLEKIGPEPAVGQATLRFEGSDFIHSCDYALLQQAFMNVISNAFTHNKPGVKIDILCTAEGGALKILIADDGLGVPEDMLHSVFEKFVRSPSAMPGGTGLGLPIAKSIVELHGGQISVHNTVAGGAAFEIRLPG